MPPGYRLESTGGGGLIAAGLLIMGGVYAGGLIVAANGKFSNGTGWVALPVAGPWLAIGERDIGCDFSVTADQQIDISGCKKDVMNYASGIGFLTGAGILQAVGLGLLVIGASSRDHQLVRYDVAGLKLVPRQFGARGAGLDVTTSF